MPAPGARKPGKTVRRVAPDWPSHYAGKGHFEGNSHENAGCTVIRGAIEVANEKLVSGWMYDTAEPLRNKLVLAFSGARCVGAGKLEIFRKDLLEAKLGDGYCGFHFPVALEKGEHPASIVVRLADSDASLIQANSRIVPK